MFVKLIYTILDKDGKRKVLHGTYVGLGDPVGSDGNNMMGKAVSFNTICGLDLILGDKIKKRGVTMATEPEIYGPVIDRLDKEFGIKLTREL